jgi:hypothetical protein
MASVKHRKRHVVLVQVAGVYRASHAEVAMDCRGGGGGVMMMMMTMMIMMRMMLIMVMIRRKMRSKASHGFCSYLLMIATG